MSTNGADLLIETAVLNGITTCFANPGTTELHLVEALDRHPAMRTVLCAFEGVCSGAADGYARIAGTPALGLYHLGPGFANSLANQHNARRHHTPMINLIGDHATWHVAHDAPLTSDIGALGGWAGDFAVPGSPDDLGRLLASVITAARGRRNMTMTVPADHAWGATTLPPVKAGHTALPVPDDDVIAEAAGHLRRPGAVLIVGGPVLTAGAAADVDRIRAATGCLVALARTARLDLGAGIPGFDDLPYFPAPLHAALAGTSVAVLAGVGAPKTFFGYPDTSSDGLPDGAERFALCDPGDDLDAALAALADELGATLSSPPALDPLPEPAGGRLDIGSLGTMFAHAIPEGAITVAESITSGAAYRRLASRANPHTMLTVLGGAIGGGLPTAVGAAVAAPDRPVLALQADGSALYTIQSLWTMAREQLDVTVVICANRRYQILDIELRNAGIELGPVGRTLTSLGEPNISFARLADGFGVPGRSVDTTEAFADALAEAAAEPGPHLIEAVI